MAEEQLNLVDGMSPSLRRIYQEAEKLNKRMLTLRSNIKALEKPMSMSYLKRELKAVEQQAKSTERAMKAMKSAESLNTKFGAFTVGANGAYYLNGMRVKNANMQAMAESYSRNVALGQMRRDRLLWNTGRLVNGLTFEERVARTKHPFVRWLSSQDKLTHGTANLNGNFIRLAVTAGIVASILEGMANSINRHIIKPGDDYVGSITRVALTSDRKYQPTEMMTKLYDTAIRTRASAEGTISLYNRIAMSGVKASNDRILRFVETFNKTMAISGTSAQENRAVMLQLAQGMGSNRLGGDEFRSIAEQAPMFKYMLARGMNVNPGALKQMGAEGKLTAEAIMTAMEKVQNQIDDIFKTAPWTIGQLLIVLQGKWQKMITSQLTGYIQLRDTVRDFVQWLDTAEGNKFMFNLIDGINYLISKVVQFIKLVSPFVKWCLENIKLITKLIEILGALWVVPKIISGIKLLRLLMLGLAWDIVGVIANTKQFLAVASAGFKGLAAILGTTVSTLSMVAAGIIAVVGSMWAFKHIYDELNSDKIRQDRQHKDARYQYEKEVDNYIRSQIGTKPTYLSASGKEVKLTPEEQAQKDAWQRDYLKFQNQKKMVMNQWDLDAKEGVLKRFNAEDMLTPEQKALRDINKSTEDFYAKMDSSKNVPMNINKVNEVGRINDDINLSTDSIQMMKAIAERQWVIQNEVTVPQKVDILVDKSTNVDPESFAQTFNEGVQLAVASTMRGEAFA